MRSALIGAALLLLVAPMAAPAPYVVTERCAYPNSGSVGIPAGATVVPGPFHVAVSTSECVGPNGLMADTGTGSLVFLPEQPLDNCPPVPGPAVGGITGKYCGPVVPVGRTGSCKATMSPFMSPPPLRGILVMLEAVPNVDNPDVGQALPSVGGGVLVRRIDFEAASYGFFAAGLINADAYVENLLPTDARIVAYPLTSHFMPPVTIRVSCNVT